MCNRRGETLVETMISLAMVAVIFACGATMMLFAARMTKSALGAMDAINAEIIGFYEGDFSEAATDRATIRVSFGVGEDLPETYIVADGIEVYVTDSGFVFFGD